MTRTLQYFYSLEGEIISRRWVTPAESLAYSQRHPELALGSNTPTVYHIYVDMIYSHDWANGTQDWLLLYLAANPGYTTGPAFVPPLPTFWRMVDLGEQRDDDEQPYELRDILKSQEDISHAFINRDSPFGNGHYFKGEWDVERQEAAEWTAGATMFINTARKVTLPAVDGVVPTPIIYTAIVAHSSTAQNHPLGSNGATHWRVLPIWDSNGFKLVKGYINSACYPKEPRTIDPEAFRVDINFQYTQDPRYGFLLFAGSKPIDVERKDAGTDGGIAIFVLTSDSGFIKLEMKRGNKTSAFLNSSNSWTPFNGASLEGTTSHERLTLQIPITGNYNIGGSRAVKLTVIHYQGKITVKLAGVKYGEFIYETFTYPFLHALSHSLATQGTRINGGDLLKHRGRHCGAVGSGHINGITPAEVSIQEMVWSKLHPEDLLE